MKITQILTSAAVAAMLALSARAGTVAATTQDLVLGFKTVDNPSNLEVDLGSYTQFTSGASFAVTQLSTADLTSLKAGWDTATNVFWGVAGGQITATNSAFLTRSATGIHTSTAPATTTVAAVGNAVNNIQAVLVGAQGLNGATSTANSNSAAFIGSSIANSYQARATTTTAFGMASSLSSTNHFQSTDLSSGARYADLYEFDGSSVSPKPTGIYLGTFILDANGLSFQGNAAAVPEPSTYALLAGGVVLGFVMLRRRMTQAAV